MEKRQDGSFGVSPPVGIYGNPTRPVPWHMLSQEDRRWLTLLPWSELDPKWLQSIGRAPPSEKSR